MDLIFFPRTCLTSNQMRRSYLLVKYFPGRQAFLMWWNEVEYLHQMYWKSYNVDNKQWEPCAAGGSFDYMVILRAIYHRRLIFNLFQLLYNYPNAYFHVKADIAFMHEWLGPHAVTFRYKVKDYWHMYYLTTLFIDNILVIPRLSWYEWTFNVPNEFNGLLSFIFNQRVLSYWFEFNYWFDYFSNRFFIFIDWVVAIRLFIILFSKISIFIYYVIKYYIVYWAILLTNCIIDPIIWSYYIQLVDPYEFFNWWLYKYYYMLNRLFITDIIKIIYLIIQDILNNFINVTKLHRHPMDIIWLNLNYIKIQINNYRDLWFSYLRVDPIILKQFYTPFLLPGILSVPCVC